jgi:hypothetical protein
VDFGDALAASCTCPPDGREEDDTPEQAVDLGVGDRQAHDFCDDAVDWFVFTAQAGDVYTITTSSWGRRADTFVSLYASDGSTLLAANDDYEGTTDYSSRIVWTAPVNGVYYLRTTNRAGLTGCATEYEVWIERGDKFTLYLPTVMLREERTVPYLPAVTRDVPTPGSSTIHPSGIITHTCPDAYERDDTWQQARAIEDGVVQVHSFDSDPMYYAADKDFVWFELSTNQSITFTATPVTGTVTLLELYDENGGALGITGTDQLTWTAPARGRNYLSVSPQNTAFGCVDVAGYELLAHTAPRWELYLPTISLAAIH